MTQIACRILLKRRSFIQLRHWGFCFGNSNWISELFDLVKVFATAILIGHAIQSLFLPIRSTLAFWQSWLHTGYLWNIFLPFSVVWNIWLFWGKKDAEYHSRFLLAYWEALWGLHFVTIYLFDLIRLLDYFQINTPCNILRTNPKDILKTLIQLLLPRIPMVWE